jgi:hypothetical protein
MKPCLRATGSILTLTFLMPVLAGCSSGYKVTGKLQNNGAPVTVSEKGMVMMSFQPAEKAGTVYPVTVEKDGSFVVGNGPDGTGPTRGKYRVAVEILDPYKDDKGQPGKDKLGGKFTSSNSPIYKEVTGNEAIIVDVGKAGG